MSTVLKIYYGVSAFSTTLATVFIVVSVVTPVWETITINSRKVSEAAEKDPMCDVIFDEDSRVFTVTRIKQNVITSSPIEEKTNETLIYYEPQTINAGLWSACDTLKGRSLFKSYMHFIHIIG